MAFIIAIVVAAFTLIFAFLQLVAHADGQKDDTGAARLTLCVGLPVAALIAASHFFHMSW